MGKLKHSATQWPLHSADPDSQPIYLSASFIAQLKIPFTGEQQSPSPSSLACSLHNLIFQTQVQSLAYGTKSSKKPKQTFH